jgi:hypothetical protein
MTKSPMDKFKEKYPNYWKDYYAAQTAHKTRCVCANCSKKLRADSSHAPLCRDCWYKTDEGKEYFIQKKAESRKQKKSPKSKSDRPAYRLGEKLPTAMTGAERFKKWYAKYKAKK